MMQFIFFYIIFTALLARADLPVAVTDPWGSTVWEAGKSASVLWTVNGEAKNPVEIALMTGVPTSATVSYILADSLDISEKKFDVLRVPDLPTRQDYFVRIGNAQEGYSYSHNFVLKGSGEDLADTSNGLLPQEFNYTSTAPVATSSSTTFPVANVSSITSRPATNSSAFPSATGLVPSSIVSPSSSVSTLSKSIASRQRNFASLIIISAFMAFMLV
ncbi:uncharacterized protein VTP21DRAFT_6663 [Calcarisporiella thermophila]|uniref:uncharacterized protein n=1 Tax=Calcarisporiella thermophila TaxID=911321 RepID=UPI0037431C00